MKSMISNYIVIAFRNILRNTLFSGVNILGLAFGICSAILIFLWVNDELSHDKFHSNIDRLYRVMENQQYSDGRLYTFASTPAPMAPMLRDKYPEIERVSRFTWQVSNLFRVDDQSNYETGHYVDPDFLMMFSFAFRFGDPALAFKDKHGIVITEALANKYFPGVDPMGKVLSVNAKDSYTITGVLGDIPKTSSLEFDYLLPFENFWDENKAWLDQWGNNNIRTFVMLKSETNLVDFGSKFRHEVREHNAKTNVELFVQPFGDSYLFNKFENGVQAGGRIENVRIFFVVALFVLIIACINFMNLSTAQATRRAKEVGLRKVIGALPGQLFWQFMGESFLTVTISAVIAVLMAIIVLPVFNEITAKQMAINFLDGRVVLMIVVIVFVTGFVSGAYPALFMSEFKPVQVLKGQVRSGTQAANFRKGLVVVQFTLSMILIISTAVVYRQMTFMQNRDIGFDRENLLYVKMQGELDSKFETFRGRLLSMPGIESVTGTDGVPINLVNSTTSISWEGQDPTSQILFTKVDVDYDFIQTMKMTMVDGRTFERTRVSDTANYIVNERAAEKFGFKGGAANQDITMWDQKGQIVGVVRDFNFGSLLSAVDPLIMRLKPDQLSHVVVRLKSGDNAAGLRSTETLWKEYAPGYPFQYRFFNEEWDSFYKPEAQQGKVFNTLAVLSIFISCLGLFGLSAFSAERRTKELGIRKALGASMPALIRLMGMEFTQLVLLASLIGCPIGWYLMNLWLSKYAYHVEVGATTIVMAALICTVVSLATVAYHSVRVAGSDPVKSLRYE